MAKKKVEPEVVIHNFVAKHMHEINKSQVFVDRKKDAKRGYSKHKKGRYSNDYLPFSFCNFNMFSLCTDNTSTCYHHIA